MKITQYILLGLITILTSCNKDQKEPQSLDYFYTRERTTLFTEEFISNSNNWSLIIDTTDHLEDSTFIDPSLTSKAQISNGVLNLFACNGDLSVAKLDISNLELSSLKYICAEIHFIEYSTHDDHFQGSMQFGYPNFFKLSFGNYGIIEHGDTTSASLGKINILFDTSTNKVLVADGNNKARENQYFHPVMNDSKSEHIIFSADTYWADMIGPVWGSTVVDRIEIYTIEE